ncbi:ubiquitin carboxyl-inal hydrolase [Leishmania donovani]|uniref:Ubiquitin carboxyl-terminal hydrolase n=1 Tax=Leishmania donovani TaxID=5661 RepID=A0A6J8FE74_LEIDO|nr:ubiquitin carboxyl-inal hydrolase [Leishmania donovani]VDZ45856.1 ubiquitin_carboxyl-inal_hydrolase_putative/GeneDB:LmjF.27.1270 [Leishmania donovani]
MFKFDYKISYDEFVRTIYHHARQYEIKVSDPYKQCVTVNALITKAKVEESKRNYANAYYYVNKCLLFFDKEENPVDFTQRDPSTKRVFAEALDLEAKLKLKELPIEYKAMIEEIDRREPERRRIVAQQLESDSGDGDGNKQLSRAVDMHLTRQQQLLSSENSSVDELLQRLRWASVPGTRNITLRTVSNGPPAPPPTYDTVSRPEPSPAPVNPVTGDSHALPASASHRSYTTCILNPSNASLSVRRRGIVNLGNTCYMNSVLQVLNSTPLGQYFLTDAYVSHLLNTKGKLTRLINSFSFVIRELNRSDCKFSVSASPFKSALGDYYEGFQNSSQQDANEFLRVVLDGIHGALNVNDSNRIEFPEIDNSKGTDDELARRYWGQYYQKNSSVIVDYCAFQERSAIVCPSCCHQSRSFNVSLSIEIPIPRTSSKVSLDDCFAAYCREEILDDSSMYMCPNCHQKVNARKQLLFYSAPPVLFITLKRFRCYGDFTTASKVNSSVFFSKTLNIASYMCSSFSKTKYHLVGIINHQGNMYGGHYTADAVGADGVWCHFSDEQVTKAEVADNNLAYILCYVR